MGNALMSSASSASQAASAAGPVQRTMKVATFNVWFGKRETAKRVAAIGELLAHQSADVVALQEVTAEIEVQLSTQGWYKAYTSPYHDKDGWYYTLILSKHPVAWLKTQPFPRSGMDRDLKYLATTIAGHGCVFATLHLESPVPSGRRNDDLCGAERRAQLEITTTTLEATRVRNVFACGDMNWIDADGEMPLPVGWSDVWDELKPGQAGFTFDCKTNGNIIDPFQSRPDRVLYRSAHFKPKSIEMIGTSAIEGTEDLFPSDHYGLVATFDIIDKPPSEAYLPK